MFADNNEITSKKTPEHQNQDNDQKNVPSSQQSQDALLNERKTSK